jgi:hypothetical protein
MGIQESQFKAFIRSELAHLRKMLAEVPADCEKLKEMIEEMIDRHRQALES